MRLIFSAVIFLTFMKSVVDSESWCANIIDGISSNSKLVCCPESCGKCGGVGCSKLPGGEENCCENKILESEKICSKSSQPPCRILPSSFPSVYFNINLKPMSETESKYHIYFEKAKAKWEEVIVGDVLDVEGDQTNTDWYFGLMGKNITGPSTVDDITIGYKIHAIDGPNNILGRSGPLRFRTGKKFRDMNQEHIPISGIMEFDTADVDDFIEKGLFESIVLHEMGHVLGFGTMWPTFLNGCGSFTCENSIGACSDPICSTYSVGSNGGVCHASRKFNELNTTEELYLENGGGEGTACSHWSERQLGNELMTGYLSPGFMPLSAITIGAMADLGYKVNYAVSDKIVPSSVSLASAGQRKKAYGGAYDGILIRTRPEPFHS